MMMMAAKWREEQVAVAPKWAKSAAHLHLASSSLARFMSSPGAAISSAQASNAMHHQR
jgi:hypothetical protein